MPRMTPAQEIAYLIKRGEYNPSSPADASERETGKDGLHSQVLEFCRKQWPPWKVIACRTDMRSTIEEGAHDCTVFLPGGKTLCVELKAKGGKLTSQQHGWRFEMGRNGHNVYVAYSLQEFVEIADKVIKGET